MGSIVDRVTLREITAETVRAVTNLAVTEQQNRFVAPNAVSLAQALFAPEAWYRAIYLASAPGGGARRDAAGHRARAAQGRVREDVALVRPGGG